MVQTVTPAGDGLRAAESALAHALHLHDDVNARSP
jgi:hypothetical protein